jgi:hypothetical protein
MCPAGKRTASQTERRTAESMIPAEVGTVLRTVLTIEPFEVETVV